MISSWRHGDEEERTGPKPSAKKSTRPLKKVNFKVIETFHTYGNNKVEITLVNVIDNICITLS